MSITKTIIVDVQTEEAQEEIQDLNQELDQSNEIVDDMGTSALESAKSFKFMGVSINGVIKTLKLLRISLIATGIGAIVVAVGALAAAFLDTQQGVDWLTRTLEPLKEVMATIWGVAQDLGRALFKIVSGDFIDGWDDMTEAVDGFQAKMGQALVRGKQLADLEIELAATEANHIKVLSDLNLQREKHRATVDDETKSIEARKQAAISLNAVNEAIFTLEKNRTQKELDLLKLRTEANDTDYEAKVEIARKEAELNQAAAVRERQRKEEFLIARRLGQGATEGQDPLDVVSPITGLSTNQIVELQELQMEFVAAGADELDAFVKARRVIAEAEAEETSEQKILRISSEAQRIVGLAVGLTSALSLIAEEGSKEQKALQIATAVLSTLSGAIAAFMGGVATFPGPYGLALGAVLAAATLAAGYANIRKMEQVQPGGSSPNGNFNTSTPSVPQFNVVGAQGTSQLAEATAGFQAEPVRSYVVSSDITTTQALDRSIESNASS